LTFCLLYAWSLHAQKEDYVWFLDINQDGQTPVQGVMLNWNNTGADPVPIDLPLGIDNNNISICDKDGNLLFWSNGCAVINRNQEVMPHGDTLNWDTYREVVGWKECLRGYPSAQNIKIVPDPGYSDGYYLFHKAFRYFGQFEEITQDLRMSYVDMELDDNNGDVVYFDSILTEVSLVPHCLEVIRSDLDNIWWIIQPVEDDTIILT
jgi:hypothetical protein